MEHPVPQNVTSFEFHLVGDMTLKQFAYLGAGLGVAYLTFVLLFTPAPYLAIPIIAFSSLFGAALAFLPILDRPFDHWLMVFFKSIYSPTKGMLKTADGKPPTVNRLQLYLSAAQPENIPAPQPARNASASVAGGPTKEILDLIRQTQFLQGKLSEAEKQINILKSTQPRLQQTTYNIQIYPIQCP